jgi:poly-gamma-glutamate synthase PgsB/CapB
MNAALEPWLTADLSAVEKQLNREALRDLGRAFARRKAQAPAVAAPGSSQSTEEEWIDFLKLRINEEMQAWVRLRRLHGDYQRGYSAVSNLEDQQRVLLDFAREMGASRRQLRQDQAAFQRWFGPDAVEDRCQHRQARCEHSVAFLLGRLGAAAAQRFRSDATSDEHAALWHWLDLETLLQPLFAHEGDARLRLAAFRCLIRVLANVHPEVQELAVDDSTLQYVYRSALHRQQDTWIQCAALELLPTMSLSSFEQALGQRLMHPTGGDDLFVRRRAVLLLAWHYEKLSSPLDLIPTIAEDPSPFVRQALVQAVAQAPAVIAATWLERLAIDDPAPEVRASTLCAFPTLLDRTDLQEDLTSILAQVLASERNEFVLRTGCHVAETAATRIAERGDPFLARWHADISRALRDLHSSAGSLKVRRWSAQTLEFLWCECQPQLRNLKLKLLPLVRDIPRSKTRRVPAGLLKGQDPAPVNRIWASIARDDFDLQLDWDRRGAKITRGHVFGFRWWRWWYEFRHPSPDKRQAFRHTVGRIFDAEIQAPSSIMAELAQTKVPGEPLHQSDEGGWRPYLPLVDQAISCLERFGSRAAVKIYTAEGLTTIEPPRGWRRLKAALTLVRRFKDYAEKRNWQPTSQEKPDTYVVALQNLGFKIRFTPHEDAPGKPRSADASVQRFFPAVFGLPALGETWERMSDYFFSLYQNTVFELGLFVVGFAALFFAFHLFYNYRQKHWRREIPLVIGGWGTRGKSGTERLKAALFNAAGYGLVSKTTGCEAMFLQAHPFGGMEEMFLYRPYDKATIWEQVNVVRIAGQLRADVLLWECMGLTPAYVKVLQRHWMHDDYSTITNTYPDHEDLQGPAGVNIPEVISCFIPEESTLITSEEQMLPILAQEARRRKTRVHPVTWQDAGLIPADILKRFPYEEHPYNIALVLGLAEQLGIERDFALKEMADRVVPDLGVLKTYPRASWHTRRLEFTNGMSANERFGTLSNWARTGFDKQDYIAEPGVCLTTVVNNRADRVPRSQVFARVLVNDISADRHVLIGGNLNGLMGYLRDAWAEHASQIALWRDPKHPLPADGLATLEQQARLLRMPIRAEWIRNRLRHMLKARPAISDPDSLMALWDQPTQLQVRLAPFQLGELETALIRQLNNDLGILREYRQLEEQIRSASPAQVDALNHAFRDQLGQWFFGKIIVVEDYFASGDQIIEIIGHHTPPGFLNRIMGIQNIKGTGLDFVYRWQAWQACHAAVQPLLDAQGPLTPAQLRPLSQFQEYGVLCEEHVRQALNQVRASGIPQKSQVTEDLDRIQARLDDAMTRLRQKMKSGGGRNNWMTRVLMGIEAFLDAGDAIRRRKTADRIYKDLANERISRKRAVLELQALTQRQKGGWLMKKLR